MEPAVDRPSCGAGACACVVVDAGLPLGAIKALAASLPGSELERTCPGRPLPEEVRLTVVGSGVAMTAGPYRGICGSCCEGEEPWRGGGGGGGKCARSCALLVKTLWLPTAGVTGGRLGMPQGGLDDAPGHGTPKPCRRGIGWCKAGCA